MPFGQITFKLKPLLDTDYTDSTDCAYTAWEAFLRTYFQFLGKLKMFQPLRGCGSPSYNLSPLIVSSAMLLSTYSDHIGESHGPPESDHQGALTGFHPCNPRECFQAV